MFARNSRQRGVIATVVVIGHLSTPLSAGASNLGTIEANRPSHSRAVSFAVERSTSKNTPDRTSPGLQVNSKSWMLAGIAATLSGALIGSIALAIGLSDACTPWAGNSCMVNARSRAGWVMGVPSMVLLGSGGGMIGYGIYLKHKARLSIRANSANVGVSISGQF